MSIASLYLELPQYMLTYVVKCSYSSITEILMSSFPSDCHNSINKPPSTQNKQTKNHPDKD